MVFTTIFLFFSICYNKNVINLPFFQKWGQCIIHMKKYQIALDIGATKILGGVIQSGQVIKKIKKPTQPKLGRQTVIGNIIKVIKKLMEFGQIEGAKLERIGIGIAGQVDNKKGVVLSTGNFGPDFKKVKLAQILNTKFKVPIQVDNDVKCFILAEAKSGAGKGYKNIIGLTFGTGIGGGIIMNGEMWRGMNNTAGEVGHMKISGQWIGQAPICGCGQKYCWESVASGRAWQKLYKKYSKKKANEIVVYNIVTGLINLSYILNPEIFILGGGLMEHEDILSKIKKEFLSRCQLPWFKKTRIVKAKLGDEAILLGALI